MVLLCFPLKRTDGLFTKVILILSLIHTHNVVHYKLTVISSSLFMSQHPFLSPTLHNEFTSANYSLTRVSQVAIIFCLDSGILKFEPTDNSLQVN